MTPNKTFAIAILAILALSTVVALGFDKPMVKERPALDNSYPTTKTVVTPQDEVLTIDFDEATVDYNSVETDIFVDPLVDEFGNEVPQESVDGTAAFVHLPYYDGDGNVSLDVYIEDTFYYANQAALDDFWDKFNPRFEMLKNRTGWSSKRLFGVPLEIYVYGHSAACYGGNASPTHSNVVFSDPMYKTGCHKPYYDGGTTHYNNPGELGDWWPYMNTALHEAMHSIMPYPIYTRSWLTEGWAEYEMYNTLTEVIPGNSIPDINQETADTYLYNGFAGYQWDPYVANDFHDTTVYNRELQRSHGYDITGHMMSKMVYEEGMDWDTFYRLMNGNKDSLDRTFSLGPPYIYYTDAFVVNVFGRAMGHTNYWDQTDPLFNYYSTAGHGYGARNISNSSQTPSMPYSDFNWFADYTTSLALSTTSVEQDESVTITATVYNNGDVNGKTISVGIYVDDVLIHQENLDINKYQNKQVTALWSTDIPGDHVIEVRVDESELKIERNENNNVDDALLTVGYAPTAPVLDPIAPISAAEHSMAIITPTATDVNEDPLTFSIDAEQFAWDTDHFWWETGPMDSGQYNVTVNVTDGMFVDSQMVTVNSLNNCVNFDKKRWCWDCMCPLDQAQEAAAQAFS